MKLNINWKNLAKAVGITAAIAAAVTVFALICKYAPWVLVCFLVVAAIWLFYFLLNSMEDGK